MQWSKFSYIGLVVSIMVFTSCFYLPMDKNVGIKLEDVKLLTVAIWSDAAEPDALAAYFRLNPDGNAIVEKQFLFQTNPLGNFLMCYIFYRI